MSVSVDTEFDLATGEWLRPSFSPDRPGLAGPLTVMGFNYWIQYLPAEQMPDGNYGFLVPSAAKIQVSLDQPESSRLETILHEALHALESALDVSLSERSVRVLSRGLFALLRDNPDYVKAVLDAA